MKARASKKIGKAPGSLIYVGDKEIQGPIGVDGFQYNADNVSELSDITFDLTALADTRDAVTWLNINGVHDTQWVAAVGNAYDVHKLHLEDILNTLHRPKLDEAEKYYFLTLKMIRRLPNGKITLEHVSLLLFKDTVITFQENKGDVFDAIRDRIKENGGQVRQRGADYLFYLLIDAIVDQYIGVVEDLGDRSQQFEDDIFQSPNSDLLVSAKQLKNDLMLIKRSVSPLREILSRLQRQEGPCIGANTVKYFADLSDNTLAVLESMESTRESLSNIMEVYASLLSIKMNNIMQTLTIIATIFIPLTFLVGIYGMNFKYMPELDWPWAYPALLGVMVALVFGMVMYFKRKDWL